MTGQVQTPTSQEALGLSKNAVSQGAGSLDCWSLLWMCFILQKFASNSKKLNKTENLKSKVQLRKTETTADDGYSPATLQWRTGRWCRC